MCTYEHIGILITFVIMYIYHGFLLGAKSTIKSLHNPQDNFILSSMNLFQGVWLSAGGVIL